MKKSLISAAVSAVAFAGSVQAAPFNSFDPVSMGMGGAGVAVGNAGNAPFFNPAALGVAQKEDDFSLVLPAVGVRAYDPNDFVTSVQDFQDNPAIFDANSNFVLDQSIQTLQNTPLTDTNFKANADIVANDLTNLSDGLGTISDRNIQAELGAGVVIGIPSKKFGMALTGSGWGAVGGVVHYRDSQVLTNVSNDISTFANCVDQNQQYYPTSGAQGSLCDPATLNLTYVSVDPNNPSNPQVNFNPSTDLKSTVDIRGIAVGEVGLSMAHQFGRGGSSFVVGVTPKYVTTQVFDYQADVNSADTNNFNAADYTKTYQDFNMDVGLAKQYNSGWRTGIVFKNVMAKEYETVRGNIVKLNTQSRLGIAHQTSWSTVALDVDLSANDPVGYEEKTRFAAIGAEINAWDFLQLRAGYRAELINGKRNVMSAGVGLFHVIQVAVAADDLTNPTEVGASVQMGVRW